MSPKFLTRICEKIGINYQEHVQIIYCVYTQERWESPRNQIYFTTKELAEKFKAELIKNIDIDDLDSLEDIRMIEIKITK